MKKRLEEKESRGWTGWDNINNFCGDKDLFHRILRNALNDDWVDVANLAMIAQWFDDKGLGR